MLSLSSTCLAIAIAAKSGTLRLEVRPSRLGGEYVAICDDRGIIEAALSVAEAEARVRAVAEKVAA
jgi:hypothetical protein